MNRPANLPLMCEAGSDLARGYPATPRLITQAEGRFLAKAATIQLIELEAGYTIAGSAMRWRDAGYSVRIQIDGDSAMHGRKFATLEAAQTYFDTFADSVTVPALSHHEGSWIIKGKQSGEVAVEVFKPDSMKLARVDFKRFAVVTIGTHLAAFNQECRA